MTKWWDGIHQQVIWFFQSYDEIIIYHSQCQKQISTTWLNDIFEVIVSNSQDKQNAISFYMTFLETPNNKVEYDLELERRYFKYKSYLAVKLITQSDFVIKTEVSFQKQFDGKAYIWWSPQNLTNFISIFIGKQNFKKFKRTYFKQLFSSKNSCTGNISVLKDSDHFFIFSLKSRYHLFPIITDGLFNATHWVTRKNSV